MSVTVADEPWWKSSVIYQIYPTSFFDSNGDGVGDLQGITAKLPYLKDLGVDVIWLSPIYKSPLIDMGYDISDYRDIDPRYGTLEDWDVLLKGVHDRGMKLMMDLVVNHTSDQHAWFIQSRSGKVNNPMRDWYVWRPPKYDEQGNRNPPNNWKSVFQGSAWEYDEASDEYYLHLYVPGQPDLNWENPSVREAVWDLMNWWIKRGCDGFRMDVINLISKAHGLPDAPVTLENEEYQPAYTLYANGPRVHEFLREMQKQVLSKYNLITVGETPFTHDNSILADYVLPFRKELNMVFQFELMDIDESHDVRDHTPLLWGEWKVPKLGEVVTRWQNYKREDGYWNAIFIENHDHARSVSRFGSTSTRTSRLLSAKLLCLLVITQSGTLYVYQGQELGMSNFPASWPLEEYKDVATINWLEKVGKERGEGADMSDVIDGLTKKARDHARTPMQWNSEPHAGFTTGKPWMRVNDDFADGWNAATQMNDPDSVWSFWKHVLATRKQNEVLIFGDFKQLSPNHDKVFAYTRSWKSAFGLVLLNFSADEVQYTIEPVGIKGELVLLLGNYDIAPKRLENSEIVLRPWEGRVYLS